MNKKDRIISAINFKGVDRIPTSFRSLDPFFKKMIRKSPGFKETDEAVNIYHEFLEYLGADFWSSGSKLNKFSTFVPAYNGPEPRTPYIADSALFYTMGINSKWATIQEYDYTYPNIGIDPPFQDISSVQELDDDFLIKRLDYFDFSKMINKADPEAGFLKYKESRDEFICMGTNNNIFMICCYLRGMEKFFIDLSFNKRLTGKLVGMVEEYCLEFNKRELEAFGKKSEVYGSWDDFAGQNGLLISPGLFKKYFLPYYRKLINSVKKYNLIFSWHCCGSIHEILPHMIDAGIDIFDVVQTSAKDMELENIYRLYGKNVCMHGGIDVQELLIMKKPEDIKKEVKKIEDLWGNDGGFIISPSHEILPETPVENVLAIYN